jgi:8-oxo-dGTP pyrophosphatase MutT (NUDIX family)
MNNIKYLLRKKLLLEVLKAKESKKHWGNKAAGLIPVTDDNKILLLQRSNLVDEPGTWVYPGGKVEKGETLKVAVKREFEEETGFEGTIKNMKKFEVYEDKGDDDFTYTTFIGDIGDEFEIVMNDGESTKGGFYSIDNLPSPLHYGLEAILPKLQKYFKTKK